MTSIYYKSTKTNPEIILDKSSGTFIISGVSIPKNGLGFYNNVLKWLENYVYNPLDETVFYIKLSDYNTATSVVLLKIMLMLQKLKLKGYDVIVYWYYSEGHTISKSTGTDFKDSLDIDFNIIKLSEKDLVTV
jgi:hypothetical protein